MRAEHDLDLLVAENHRLEKQVRKLQERLAAFESSRWWRLHPRRLLGRADTSPTQANGPIASEESFPLDFDDADRELCRRVEHFTMTTPPRIYALARAVEHVVRHQIPGALVECGVWRGGSMMAVALTLLRLGVHDRELYLFDTFEGMTEPGDEDVKHTGEPAADLLSDPEAQGQYRAAASLEEVRDAVLGVGYPEISVHFVMGRVEDTVPEQAPPEIALLRLDTDWYSSTKHELTHLYPRLASGGVLIVDDYAYWQGAKKAVDEYFAANAAPLLLNRVDYTARIAVKP
jgi:hypothetical protein